MYSVSEIRNTTNGGWAMFLSKSCIYGIQATIHVAAQEERGYVPINRIAERLNISFHFLTKVLQQFTSAEILTSYRGPKGGVALARPPEQISLYDLISAIDGKDIFTECLLGLPGCGDAAPCPAHEQWMLVRERFTEVALELNLKTLAKNAKELNVRLTREGVEKIIASQLKKQA